MTGPMFSIIVATRNRPVLLADALHSVAAQTWADFECIVVDDGSTADARAENARTVAELGSRFQLVTARPPDSAGSGAAAARNTGARQAKGEVLSFLDDDDRWIDREYLVRAARIFTKGGADLCLCNYGVHSDDRIVQERQSDWRRLLGGCRWEEDGIWLVTHVGLARLLRHRSPIPSTMMVRREIFEETGGFYEWLHGWSEDFNLWCRVADRSRCIAYCDVPAVSYRSPVGDAISLQYGTLEQCFNELGATIHVAMTCRNRYLRAAARAREAWTYRSLGVLSARLGNRRDAVRYAIQSCLTWPSCGALLFALRTWASVIARQTVGFGGEHAAKGPLAKRVDGQRVAHQFEGTGALRAVREGVRQ